MALRFRPMQRKDIGECAGMIAAHPVIGPRYGPAIHDLRVAWLRLLDSDAMITALLYEAVNERATQTFGLGVGLFVRDVFVRELKTPPLFWFGPELAKRIAAGNSPALSDREVREANSREGLNIVVWEAFPRPEFAQRPDVYHLMIESYREVYRGFLLKEMISSQAESAQRLQWSIDSGGLIWNPAKAQYVTSARRNLEEFVREPHIVGITRELEFGRLGSWVGTLFDYQPPKFRFSRSEQRLLHAALSGVSGTDQELSETLHVSLPTIKKMWSSIYRRVIDRSPKSMGDCARAEVTERGKEKRRHLLAYLRERPEELRPVSQALLKKSRIVTNRKHRVPK
jgi:hypothetical protein